MSVLYPPDTDTSGLARENARKPAETVAISASSKTVDVNRVADAFLRGIENNRQHIAVDPLARSLVQRHP